MANKTEIRIGGSGGQGIVLAAQILGKAAILDGKHALQPQAYGAEARGSLAKSEVIISDGRISFPAVRKPDILVTMTQEALDKLSKDLKENGLLIIDTSYVTKLPEMKASIHRLLITETAKKQFGETIYANMIMLGALTHIAELVTLSSMEKTITENVSTKTVEANINAFRTGLKLS
jgi:2-oxoglutarate ferredoxin oxidoreductase subunit gamma